MFDKLVKLILFYGCEVWGFNKVLTKEKNHTFCESLSKIKRSRQYDFIELGRLDHTIVQILKFWLGVTNKSDRKFINVIHQVMQKENQPYIINWLSHVKVTLIQ